VYLKRTALVTTSNNITNATTTLCALPPLPPLILQTGEIVKALKPRMSDTQANLKPLAVTAIAHVVASLDNRSAGAKVGVWCIVWCRVCIYMPTMTLIRDIAGFE